MSETLEPNKKQEQFLNSTHKNVLVSASAGTGKTTSMINKLLKLITVDKVNIKNILVLTFTDASAGEMKQKLYKSLIDRLNQVNLNLSAYENDKASAEEEKSLILQAIENLNYADIGTFHSIFKRFITKYFYMLDIDPSFSILAEQEQKIMLNKAVENVFEKHIISKDLNFFELQEQFNKNRQDTAFKETLVKLYNVSKEITNFHSWLNALLEESYSLNLDENKSARFLMNYVKDELQGFYNSIYTYKTKCQTFGWVRIESYLQSCLNFLTEMEKEQSYERFAQLVFHFKPAGTLRFGEIDPQLLDFSEEIKSLIDVFKTVLANSKKHLVSSDKERIINDTQTVKGLILKIAELISEIDAEYTKMKNKKSFIDFNDLQTLVLNLLNHAEIAKEISASYEYIFVDEFQDVNEIQNEILHKITRNNNLHMIGDVKQSIYEFRLASPKIFIEKYNSFMLDTKNNEVINFNKNYRSSNHILQFVNAVFDELITKNTIGIDYKTTSQLECGNVKLQEFDNVLTDSMISNISLTIFNRDIEEEKQPQESEEQNEQTKEQVNTEQELSEKEKEAEIVVQQVNELLGKPFYNAKTNKVEKLNYKDIVILTRDNSAFVNILYHTLMKYKVPCYALSKGNIFKSNEVIVLFSYLQLLSNECNDYALATVLKSPIVNLSYNDLSIIRLTNNKASVSFYECTKEFIGLQFNDEKHNRIKLVVTKFFEELKSFRKLLNYYTIAEVFLKVMNAYQLTNHYKSMPDGNIKLNNINEFLSLLNSESYKFNITACVNYLTQLSQKDDFKINMKSGDNAVRILTMHKSKGLEFPAVIVAELGKNFSKGDANKELLISQSGGIGIPIKNTEDRVKQATIQYNAIMLEKQKNELKEQIRLLYVALTRAKNYLYLTGSYNLKNFKSLQQKSIVHSRSFLELILKTINHKDYAGFINKKEQFYINKDLQSSCKVHVISKEQLNLSEEKTFTFTHNHNLVNLELSEKLQRNFAFIYSKPKNISVKNSVTSLLSEQDYVFKNTQPKTLSYNDTMAVENTLALEIGTMHHLVMQKLNYNESQEEIMALLNSLVEQNYFTKDLLNHLKVQHILNAIHKIAPFITPGTKVLKEQQFILSDNYNNIVTHSNNTQKVIVQGVIDLVIVKENFGIIIDFKTNKNTSVTKLLEAYKLQLGIYSKAVQDGLNLKNVKSFIYSFELNELIEV